MYVVSFKTFAAPLFVGTKDDREKAWLTMAIVLQNGFEKLLDEDAVTNLPPAAEVEMTIEFSYSKPPKNP